MLKLNPTFHSVQPNIKLCAKSHLQNKRQFYGKAKLNNVVLRNSLKNRINNYLIEIFK